MASAGTRPRRRRCSWATPALDTRRDEEAGLHIRQAGRQYLGLQFSTIIPVIHMSFFPLQFDFPIRLSFSTRDSPLLSA
ncbi:hypothetical protein BJX68DRAFT_245484 [Aspergillus pseudodeflectus]|uniref:Uncharacterized protein n=1 Tax=Aspergillus pseudodeflectus TaxID=176178 RepID=A0ABR4JN57_9EURO